MGLTKCSLTETNVGALVSCTVKAMDSVGVLSCFVFLYVLVGVCLVLCHLHTYFFDIVAHLQPLWRCPDILVFSVDGRDSLLALKRQRNKLLQFVLRAWDYFETGGKISNHQLDVGQVAGESEVHFFIPLAHT